MPKLRGKYIEGTIVGLSANGSGILPYGERSISVYNALPQEQVIARVYKQRRVGTQAIATTIVVPSPCRCQPLEEHFLSCSPWQIMDFASENHWKSRIGGEFLRAATGLPLADLNLVAPDRRFGYRNKMEFSFVNGADRIALALYRRGSKSKCPIIGCALASPAINQAAAEIVAWLNQRQVPGAVLKSLIIRSNSRGQVLAGLFVKSKEFPTITAGDFSQVHGLDIYFSNPQSPASVPTERLGHSGINCLREEIAGSQFQFDLMSFFQINIPIFAIALQDIGKFIADRHVVDYYCGVGAISVANAGVVKDCVMVDNIESAIDYARHNITANGLSNYRAYCGKAEKLRDYITTDKTLIVDPPRSGIHPRLLRHLLEAKPQRIVYLSCNIKTCAADIEVLRASYRLIFARLYNFFPASPHLETLVVLQRT